MGMTGLLDVCDVIHLGPSKDQLNIDFLGRSNVWIDDLRETEAITLARHIICEALEKTAPGQLTIVGYDKWLSGIFAPFAELSAGDVGVLSFIDNDADLKAQVSRLRQHIRNVQNVIQGQAGSLTEFRQQTGRPVESYKLIVLVLDMGLVDNDVRAELSLLMKSGPAAGVSFLVVSTTILLIEGRGGEDVKFEIEDLFKNVRVLEIEDGVVTDRKTKRTTMPQPVDPKRCLAVARRRIALERTTALPVVRFDEIHNLSMGWGRKSTEGVTFTIGKYGVNDVSITLGDEVNQRHNALITGAVGQGKSNLISVIVHSMCLRYAPSELVLYLLDFKEGVTFKVFSNIGKEDYLPHARTLGLESDVDFGVAVLDALSAEYRSRMALLKQVGAKSIRELRLTNPGIELPRIVVVIDEFQMMFGDDLQTGQQIAERLEKSVRLFRAAGIHFILASQTLGGNIALSQRRDAIFSQIPIRIALKNSIVESQQTLGLNNTAAAYLRPREAIVNLDGGEVSQNRKATIAFADETVLAPLRRKWWERSRRTTLPPFVFESERRISVEDDGALLGRLHEERQVPCALLGDRVSISGEKLEVPMPHEPGRNLAILGAPEAQCNHALGMLEGAAISLAHWHANGDARFVACDFSGGLPPSRKYPRLESALERTGYFLEDVAPEDFADRLGILLEQARPDETVYVLGLSMDRWRYDRDPYGQGSPLKKLVEEGPFKQIHFLGWWIKSAAFTEQVAGYGSSDAFNTKVFLRIDERTVQSLTSPFVKWRAKTNRALASDPVELGGEVSFVPYSPLDGSAAARMKMAL